MTKALLTLHDTSVYPAGSFGLGALTGVTQCTVTRERNAIPTMTMVQGLKGNLVDQLKYGMVIEANDGFANDEQGQKFRITDVSKAIDQVTVTAQHIAGDLANVGLTGQVSQANDTPKQAWDALTDSMAYEIPDLQFNCDSNKVANTAWDLASGSILNCLLGADQAGDAPTNSIEGLYGLEFKFNNHTITAKKHLGRNDGKFIKYGQNMENITDETSTDSTYDGIIPYAKYNPNEEVDNSNGQSDFDGQGDVQYVGAGGASTYDSPYAGHHVVGHVQNGSFYHVSKTASQNTVNNDTWYMLDNGEWIDQHFFTFDKSGAYVVNKITGQGTVTIPDNSSDDNPGLIVSYSGRGNIVYSGRGGVAVWNSPFSGHSLTGEYLRNGTAWKILRKATTDDGKTWYDLGSNQWVDGQYLSISQTYDYASTPTSGILTISGNVTAYTSPTMAYKANWHPRVGSRWKIGSTATGSDGSTLYQVSTNIWVKGDEGISFSTAGSVQPNDDNDRLAVAKATGRIPIYSQPNGTHVTEHYLTIGQQLPIMSQAESNGKTWYEIGEGQWVDASYFSFSSATDVAPGDGSDDGTGEDESALVEEVTLTLPEKYILAPSAVHVENPRLLTVDLSEYVGVQPTEDKLREVAQAYMKEYRIGYPNVSMTVQYQQMQGQFKQLTSVDLYDLVNVEFDELGIAEKAEVNSVTWNVLEQRYDTITIGSLPITYDHALGKYIQKVNTKTRVAAERKATHLFGEMNQIVKLQGDDQKAAIDNLMDQLNMAKDNWSNKYDSMNNMITSITTDVNSMKSWVESPGDNVIQAYPNWQNPTELRAKTPNGGYMVFDSAGLEYVGSDNVPQTILTSDGYMGVEHLRVGEGKSLMWTSVQLNGLESIYSNSGQYKTVMSTGDGFSTTADDGTGVAISPYRVHWNNGSYDVDLDAYDVVQIKQALWQHWKVNFDGSW